MKKIASFLCVGLLCVGVNAQQLSLKDITTGRYAQRGISPTVSSADGEYYYQADNNKTMIVKYSYKKGEPVDTIFSVKQARECTINSFQGFVISPDEKRLLVYTDAESIYRRSFKANYFYYDVRHNLIRKLTENAGKQSIPTFSQDGRMLSYMLDNNIWLAKFDYDTESQITKNGVAGKIINGGTDWVYEEEFATTSLMSFSADNRLLAFVSFDETDVPEYSFQQYNNKAYPDLISFKYPKTGEKNSKVTCNIFDIEAKTIRKVELPSDVEYIPRIEFLPSGDELAILTLNRNQNDFNLFFANARSTVARQILGEKNDRYVDSELFKNIQFFSDQFTYLSEKNGYTHIYLYNNKGVLNKQLTDGKYDVTKILSVDPIEGTIFFESAEESPLQRSIYKVDIKKGAASKINLSTQKGVNSATFSKNGKYYINRYTNTTTPAILTLHDAKGKELRMLENNNSLQGELAKVKLPQKEFITVKAADGTDLNAYILKPVDFSSSKKYPLVMVQYSGPDSQQVLDRFEMDWTSYLTTQGYIVASVDGRGTGARGEEFRKCTYMNLGVKESDDQIAAANYFGSLPYIDKNKIAIWGWSYGGYNVLMSMSRGQGIFKAGVAIAAVTDWRFYDTVYGERYMRTPQENGDGYKASSAIESANKLEGNLLLIHGSADDNVHAQNAFVYSDALIKANKQFDMFIFPDKDHSIVGGSTRTYLYEKIIKFLKTNM